MKINPRFISVLLFLIGFFVMLTPWFLNSYEFGMCFLAVGFIPVLISMTVDFKYERESHEPETLDDIFLDEDENFLSDEQESEYLNSQQFKDDCLKSINFYKIDENTWDVGLPKIYMNDKGQIIKHWKDGKIEIIKESARDGI